MTRTAVLLGAAALTLAAAPAHPPPLTLADAPAPAAAPQASASDWSAFAPAPVPNHDLALPVTRGVPKVELTPGIVRTQQRQYQGEGYTPNSTVQEEQTRKIKPAPGLNLSVPLE